MAPFEAFYGFFFAWDTNREKKDTPIVYIEERLQRLRDHRIELTQALEKAQANNAKSANRKL